MKIFAWVLVFSLNLHASLQLTDAFPGVTFQKPIFMTQIPDGTHRFVVLEQEGVIRILDSHKKHATAFMDIQSKVESESSEEGLLGIAFDPKFKENGFFYVNYTAANPLHSVIARYRANPGFQTADVQSEKILLTLNQPYSNHNGGMLAFGPDKMLYAGFGDGGSGGDPHKNGQNKKVLLGKILRIDVSTFPYSIPQDNPFVGEGNGVKEEIWSYGMRNPWRFSFDKFTGKLWVGDVGQDKYEEIDIIEKGGNCGWNQCEGLHGYPDDSEQCPSTFLAPIFEYNHQVGQCIIGGYVYRGKNFATLQGKYIYGDYVTPQVWALTYDGKKVVSNDLLMRAPMPVSSFAEGEDGELYVLGYQESGGKIYKFVDKPSGAEIPKKLSGTGIFSDLKNLVPDPSYVPYDVNMPLWSDGALKRRWMKSPSDTKITFHADAPWNFPPAAQFVKHFEMNLGDRVRRLETRVLHQTDQGWEGYTYRWNADESDADLVETAATEELTIRDPNGAVHTQTWTYPGPSDCLRCHTTVSGGVLGVRTEQVTSLLSGWNQQGFFDSDIGDISSFPVYPHLDDANQPIAARAKAYLAANCSHCHQPGGPAPANMDFRFATALDQMRLINESPVDGDLGIAGALLVKPRDPDKSLLIVRMSSLNDERMPPLASSVVHKAAVDLLRAWIQGM